MTNKYKNIKLLHRDSQRGIKKSIEVIERFLYDFDRIGDNFNLDSSSVRMTFRMNKLSDNHINKCA